MKTFENGVITEHQYLEVKTAVPTQVYKASSSTSDGTFTITENGNYYIYIQDAQGYSADFYIYLNGVSTFHFNLSGRRWETHAFCVPLKKGDVITFKTAGGATDYLIKKIS